MDIAATAPHERYRRAMVEVKQRLRAIDRTLCAKKSRTTSAEFDNEFMWLQVRKIVELVAFGGIMLRFDAVRVRLRMLRLSNACERAAPGLHGRGRVPVSAQFAAAHQVVYGKLSNSA